MSFKLYVWGELDAPAYGADTLIVMASNLREARKLAKSALNFGFGREHDERMALDVSKVAPTKVIDEPDAVYCWWCE